MGENSFEIKSWNEMTTGEKVIWCIKFPFAMLATVICLLPLAWFYTIGNRIDESKQMTFWVIGAFIDKTYLVTGLFKIRPTGWWFLTPKKVKIIEPESYRGKILPYICFRHIKHIGIGSDETLEKAQELSVEKFEDLLISNQNPLRIGPLGNLVPISIDIDFPEETEEK